MPTPQFVRGDLTGSADGTRYSTLRQITTANASRLRQVCSFDSGEAMSMQSGPVVVGGRLYFTTDTSTGVP